MGCRGQDLSEFMPRPDVILMSDVVYYKEVCVGLIQILARDLMCYGKSDLKCFGAVD